MPDTAAELFGYLYAGCLPDVVHALFGQLRQEYICWYCPLRFGYSDRVPEGRKRNAGT